MADNFAAWIPAAKAKQMEVRSAPMGVPRSNQILVKNHALAINPIDVKLQDFAVYPLTYPTILGQDVAGEVVAIGPEVTRYKVGDRVIGTTAGFSSKDDTAKGFQKFSILENDLSAQIPAEMPFQQAVVLPLAVTTAASALFQKEFLNLQHPAEPAQQPTGSVALVWGGASSVG